MKRAAILFVLALSCCARPQAPPPSILLVTIDTLRADHVGCYGDRDAKTPALDRIAAEGVRFDEARSHVPLTLPSHATILTGRLPPRHGVRGNGLFRLDGGIPTVASALRSKGYQTAAVVSSVVLDRAYGLDAGFDVYEDNQRVGDKAAFGYVERGASQIADAVAPLLPRLKPPFFLWVHLYDPHEPWVAPERFGRGYDAEVAFADSALGEIRRLATERAQGALVTIATSDHGESLGQHGENQHGYTLHQGVLRVPLVACGEGIPKGKVVSHTVGLVDVAPTIAELAEVKLEGADGRSLVSLWSRAGGKGSEELWEETLHPLYDSGWAPLRGLLTAEWHFIDAPRPELYARRDDPGDTRDLAAGHGEVVSAMRTRLASFASRLGDAPEPQPQLGDDEENRELLEKLASLGYLASGAGKGAIGTRLDPKDGLPAFLAVEDAEELLERGDARGAYDRVVPFAAAASAGPRVWHVEAKALLALRKVPEAEDALSRALAADPRSEFLRLTYVDVLRAKGDAAGARAELERVVRANPRSVEASLELASIAAASGDRAGAEAVLAASYAAGVRDPDALVALGRLLDLRGARDEAAARFAEALSLQPHGPVALYELGRAALRAGDSARAIENLRRCADGPLAVECRIELARALVVGPRDLVSAREVLVRARELAGTQALRAEVDRRLAALEGMRP
jgi:arylsulfatase A-like enzyme/Tfp pilus assembly protein PilF